MVKGRQLTDRFSQVNMNSKDQFMLLVQSKVREDSSGRFIFVDCEQSSCQVSLLLLLCIRFQVCNFVFVSYWERTTLIRIW